MTQCLQQMSKTLNRRAEVLSTFMSMNFNMGGGEVEGHTLEGHDRL
jgi:hypothetical protein